MWEKKVERGKGWVLLQNKYIIQFSFLQPLQPMEDWMKNLANYKVVSDDKEKKTLSIHAYFTRATSQLERAILKSRTNPRMFHILAKQIQDDLEYAQDRGLQDLLSTIDLEIYASAYAVVELCFNGSLERLKSELPKFLVNISRLVVTEGQDWFREWFEICARVSIGSEWQSSETKHVVCDANGEEDSDWSSWCSQRLVDDSKQTDTMWDDTAAHLLNLILQIKTKHLIHSCSCCSLLLTSHK